MGFAHGPLQSNDCEQGTGFGEAKWSWTIFIKHPSGVNMVTFLAGLGGVEAKEGRQTCPTLIVRGT